MCGHCTYTFFNMTFSFEVSVEQFILVSTILCNVNYHI
jgi:hypothetical protein